MLDGQVAVQLGGVLEAEPVADRAEEPLPRGGGEDLEAVTQRGQALKERRVRYLLDPVGEGVEQVGADLQQRRGQQQRAPQAAGEVVAEAAGVGQVHP